MIQYFRPLVLKSVKVIKTKKEKTVTARGTLRTQEDWMKDIFDKILEKKKKKYLENPIKDRP